MERSVLARLFEALAEHHVEYVLVGGVAVNLHGIIRATEDVDLAIRADHDNVAWSFDGTPVQVATPASLDRMKRATTRPIDAQDAARLAAAFDVGEVP